MAMTDQLDVAAWTRFNGLGARLWKIEVVSFYFQRMHAGAFCVDMQGDFVGVRRFHGGLEIKDSAGAQFEMINTAGECGERGMGRTLAHAIPSLRYLDSKLTTGRIRGYLDQTSCPQVAELDKLTEPALLYPNWFHTRTADQVSAQALGLVPAPEEKKPAAD